MNIGFNRAFYIMLGKKGKWQQDCIANSIMRNGWARQSLDDINNGRWDRIRVQLIEEEGLKPGLATREVNALRSIRESTPDDLWIAFSGGTIWWCRLAPGDVEEDSTSKFRRVQGRWSDRDVAGNRMEINKLPGIVAKIGAFRGVFCRVGPEQMESLRRVLNNEPSVAHNQIREARVQLTGCVESGLKNLHWKDFETLVDLVFRGSGWRRVSILGQTQKYLDLELEDQLSGDRYQVQIKSESNWQEFQSYVKQFDGSIFRRLYYVVHTCGDKKLETFSDPEGKVELLLAGRLAEKIVDLGLVGWLMEKVRFAV